MIRILIYFFIGVSLSIDAFSLAITIGTLSPSKKKKYELISIIGLFHFIMPLCGYYIGNTLIQLSTIKTNIIVSLIFFVLGIEMLLEKKEEHIIKNLAIIKIIVIALAVSLDSFAVGIVFGLKKEIIVISVPIISISSMIFTKIGLELGTYLSNKYQEKGKIIGVIILLLLGIKNLFEL